MVLHERAGVVEDAFVFDCEGAALVGVVSAPAAAPKIGVLVVVGGPQYRAGSHRCFVDLARRLAERGIAVMRFDYRGMGDSGGTAIAFDETHADIAAALAVFTSACPTIERYVLCGLCDGATAALLYSHSSRDPRVYGLLLLNPWVHSERMRARARVKHYYGLRVLQPSFWRKVLSGGVGLRAALTLLRNLHTAAKAPRVRADAHAPELDERVGTALDSFTGPLLVLLSSNDVTAQEFAEFDRERTRARRARGAEHQVFAGADHTFASSADRARLAAAVGDWLERA